MGKKLVCNQFRHVCNLVYFFSNSINLGFSAYTPR